MLRLRKSLAEVAMQAVPTDRSRTSCRARSSTLPKHEVHRAWTGPGGGTAIAHETVSVLPALLRFANGTDSGRDRRGC